jgi:biopolymer transport protein ExbD
MAFGGFDSGGDQKPMAEINMVPLIDVMLVLLVIFIITAPLLTHSVKIDLPKASSNPNITKPEHVQIGIRQDGRVFWNGVQAEKADLQQRMSQAATLDPQPEIHIRADRLVHYENVAQVMSMAGKAGLKRIGFVTDPSGGD